MLHFLFGLGKGNSYEGNKNLLKCLQSECEKESGLRVKRFSSCSVSLSIHGLNSRKGVSEVAGSPQGMVLCFPVGILQISQCNCVSKKLLLPECILCCICY